MPSQEVCSTMLVQAPVEVNNNDIKAALEKGDAFRKIDILKKMIGMQLNGDNMQAYIMPVMKYCSREDNHTLKKLLLYFWEVVDKFDEKGQSLPEMIMLCDALLTDLQHPNEYVRGMTLRFLCKLKERDLFEPLVSAVVANLTHRVSYVRRNAVLAVHTIFANCPQLLPDAPEIVEKFLVEENDVSARRNAFTFLVQCAQERAVRFLARFREENDVTESGDVFQLAVVDFIKVMIQLNPYDKAKYVPLILAVMQSKNPAVAYQCATTLLKLSSSPTAIKHAAQIFIQLLTTHSDVNVRLIALDRLKDMRRDFPDSLNEMLMELVRGLSTGNHDLRLQVLQLCLDTVGGKTVEAFVQNLKKELVRSQAEPDASSEAQQEYRQQVVRAIHKSVMRHITIAGGVVPIMLDYVCEPGASSHDVIVFMREVMERLPEMRADVLDRLLAVFPMISNPKVLRTVLWLFGVHGTTATQVANVLAQIKASLEPFPLAPFAAPVGTSVVSGGGPTAVATTTVREDGTYVQSLVYTERRTEADSGAVGLRAQIVAGDFFLAAALASTLAKLVVRVFSSNASTAVRNTTQVDAIDIMHQLVQYGTARTASAGGVIDNDSHERIRLAITVAQNPKNDFLLHLVEDSSDAYKNVHVLSTDKSATGSGASADIDGSASGAAASRADAPIVFSQLVAARGLETMSGNVAAAADDILAAVSNETIETNGNFMAKLHRVRQLSGFSDPVYVEAAVTVHQYDVLVEWSVTNQTSQTLSNLCIEVAPLGEMKVCDRPQYLTVAGGQTVTLRTSLKVSSTETGIIYGSCLFDSASGGSSGRGGAASERRSCVILNEITIDIMDYIKPGTCTVGDFRTMWAAFPWENRIVVNTDITDLWDYVQRVQTVTNMRPIEPKPEEECPYLSCSLYAQSVFGEDALAHVSLELAEDTNRVDGVVRIRSKTQAIALGLGEKLTKQQRPALLPSSGGGVGGGAGTADIATDLATKD